MLNDVIKSFSWYWVFVTLPIQIDIAKNNIDIGASLNFIHIIIHYEQADIL